MSKPEEIIASIERGRLSRGLAFGKTFPPIPKTAKELRAYVGRGLTFHEIRKELQMSERTLERLARALDVDIPRTQTERLAQIAGELQTLPAEKPAERPRRQPTVLERLRAEQETRRPTPPASPPERPRERFIVPTANRARPATSPVYVTIDEICSGAEMAGLLYGASQIAAGLGGAACHVKLDLRKTVETVDGKAPTNAKEASSGD